MGLCISTTSRRQSTGRTDQGAINGESQRPPRYASFSCYVYWLLSEHGTFVALHVLYQSISWMTIPFSTCFIFLGHLLWTKIASRTGYSTDGGGMRLPMFAEDGETLFLAQRPIWVFPCSVHMARPLQTCWPIHPPFHSSSFIV